MVFAIMTDILYRKALIIGVILLFIGININTSICGRELISHGSTDGASSSMVSSIKLESEISKISSVTKKGVLTYINNLPDLVFIELHAWWGSLNTTGIFIDYGVNNSGDTYHSTISIESNLSFFANDNNVSFGYITQTPLFYPSKWYKGEILGGCHFFEMDEKPTIITAKIDFTNSIPETNETNNNLTIPVPHGVMISGTVYKKENSEIIPFEGVINLNQYNKDSLSDFGYRNYRSDANGHYNMSLYPKEPLGETHIYDIMASNNSMNLKIIGESHPVKAGENTTVDFIIEGLPPNKPYTPFGRGLGKINSTYRFFSSTTDADDDDIYYKFKWGDGTYSDWFGPYASDEKVSASHTWSKTGIYSIEVVSKDSLGMLSKWSDSLTIKMSESKQLSSQLSLHFLKNSQMRFLFFHVKASLDVIL
jgi:hypothetical protein